MKTVFTDMTSDLFKMLSHLSKSQITDADGESYIILTQNTLAATFNASVEDATAAFKYFKTKDYIDSVKGSRSKYVLTDLAKHFLADMEKAEASFNSYVEESLKKQADEKKAATREEVPEDSAEANC